MDTRRTLNRKMNAAVLWAALIAFMTWGGPAWAIKVEHQTSKRPQTTQTPSSKESGDSVRTSTRSLLDNVESQKNAESAKDSLDTWIDRDGDGVNDNMKKTPTPERHRVKTLQPQPTEKKVRPESEPKKENKTGTTSDDSTTKKRRR
jgi:hypothetical protein